MCLRIFLSWDNFKVKENCKTSLGTPVNPYRISAEVVAVSLLWLPQEWSSGVPRHVLALGGWWRVQTVKTYCSLCPGAGRLTFVFFPEGTAFFWKALVVSEAGDRELPIVATHSGLVAMLGQVGTVTLLFEGSINQWLLLPWLGGTLSPDMGSVVCLGPLGLPATLAVHLTGLAMQGHLHQSPGLHISFSLSYMGQWKQLVQLKRINHSQCSVQQRRNM